MNIAKRAAAWSMIFSAGILFVCSQVSWTTNVSGAGNGSTAASACVSGNILQDSGFETSTAADPISNSFWASSSNVFDSLICNDAVCGNDDGASGPRNGDFWVWFGGTDNGDTETLSQVITIPAAATATLHYYLRIGFVQAPFTDVLNVKVDGTVVQSIMEPSTAESGYTLRSVNLNAYADGVAHTLSFEYDGPTGGGFADFNVDDVTVDVVCPSITPTPTPSQFSNISTRGVVQTGDNVMIGGIIIKGTGPKKVIVRAIGPTLTQYGVANALTDPMLELYDANQTLLAKNDNWQTTQIFGIITSDQVGDIQSSGLAPPQPSESAIVATLQEGNYTAIVRGKNSTTGVALVEAYDLSLGPAVKLANISTRGVVQTGDNVMIGGLITSGSASENVLVRAIGPTLASYGVANPLQDPILELHDSNGHVVASNDNWRSTQEADIVATGLAPPNSAESAIVATLAPGSGYTAIVRGKNDTTGVALVDAYNLGPSPLKVTSGGTGTVAPFTLLYLGGTGFDPTAAISVHFFDINGFSVEVPVVDVTSTRLTVPAPVYLTPGSGAISAGTVNWEVVQRTAVSTVRSETHFDLQLQALPSLLSSPGSVAVSLLKATVDLANNHLANLTGTAWDSPEIRSNISAQIDRLNTLITNIQNLMGNPSATFSMGTAAGISMTVHQSDLATVDRMIVGWLQSISVNVGPPVAATKSASDQTQSSTTATACTQSQAGNFAQAATQGDPDLDKWAKPFVYAPRQDVLCGVPDAFNLSYQIVGGGAGIGIGIVMLAAGPELAGMAVALPTAALLAATLEGTGGMMALGGVLNETTDAGRKLVKSADDKLWELMLAPIKLRLPNWAGAGAAISAGAYSFITAMNNVTIGPPTQYVLTISIAGAGSGTVTKSPSQSNYASGTAVTLTASPNTGSTFTSWSGAASGTDPVTSVTMTSNKSVTATFDPAADPCGNTQVAGGDTPDTRSIQMGQTSGTFNFSYDTQSIEDRIVVSYQGHTLFDTGCVGASGSVNLTYSGTSTTITVQVTPNCANPGGSGTAWSYTVDCPQ